MLAENRYRDYKRTVELLLSGKGRVLVFNPNIGWISVVDSARPLKKDLLRVTPMQIEEATLNDDPAGIATWQALTVKFGLHRQ